MSGWRGVTLACALLPCAQAPLAAAQSNSVIQARPAFGYDPATRCPDLSSSLISDQATAVVQFRVGPTGVPSQASVKSPSGSEPLDAAATGCVMRLRFYPLLRDGDGTAIDSWQQIALGWRKPEQQPAPHCDPAVTSPPADKSGGTGRSLPRQGRVGVCVCLDEGGRLAQPPTILQSAGDTGFDQAAIGIVNTGSYPPLMTNGKPVPGCFRVTVRFEVK